MMKDAHVGKTEADWEPPAGYESALRISVDKAKAKEAKGRSNRPLKKRVTSVRRDEDSASDDDAFSDLGARAFSIQAITRFQSVTRGKPL